MVEARKPPLLYLDSMVFIYFAEGDGTTRPPAGLLFEHLRETPGAAVTSELTIAEVLAPRSNADRELENAAPSLPLDVKRRVYLDLLVWSRFVQLCAISRSILQETANLRAVSPQKLPDAIHVVTAISEGCRMFVSADRRIRVPEGIVKIAPDADGVARVLEALP